jgi:hypothetical protein
VLGRYIAEFRFAASGGAVRATGEDGRVDGEGPGAMPHRHPRTVNHRLTVLARFFGHLIERDAESGRGAWYGRGNPVPERRRVGSRGAGVMGRDAPKRGRRAERQ